MDRVERLGVVDGLGADPLSLVGTGGPCDRIGYCTNLAVPYQWLLVWSHLW